MHLCNVVLCYFSFDYLIVGCFIQPSTIVLPLLFQTMQLSFRPCKNTNSGTLNEILRDLRGASWVCASVRYLHLVMRTSSRRAASEEQAASAQFEDFKLLVQVLALFPQIRHVTLRDVIFELDHPQQLDLLPSHFLHLDKFTYMLCSRNPHHVHWTDILPVLSLLGEAIL